MGPTAGAVRVSFWSTAEHRNQIIDDDAGGPFNTEHNPGFKTTIFRQFLGVDYGITDAVSAFVEGSWVRIDSKGPNEAAYEDGFGDTRALLRYTFTVIPHEHVEGEANGPLGFHFGVGKVALGAGVSLPTGEPARFQPSSSPVSEASLQRGTGTFDPLFTAVFSQAVDKGSVFAGAAVRIPGGESRFDYRVGEAVQLNLGAAIPVSNAFDVVPKVSYLYNAPDEFQGHDAFASGGHWISLVPGIRWRATEHVDVEASVEVPVFRDLRTEALDAPARLAVGISYKF